MSGKSNNIKEKVKEVNRQQKSKIFVFLILIPDPRVVHFYNLTVVNSSNILLKSYFKTIFMTGLVLCKLLRENMLSMAPMVVGGHLSLSKIIQISSGV